MIKNLGQVSAISIGINPPSNEKLIWYDTNSEQFKIYSQATSSWMNIFKKIDGLTLIENSKGEIRVQIDNAMKDNSNFPVSNEVIKEYVDQINKFLQSQIDAIVLKPDVSAIVPTYAALLAYDTSKINENDWGKVIKDETHNDELTYYQWMSGVWTYVQSEGSFYSKSESDARFVAKRSGYSLSKNDFTDADRNKLAGIESGAQMNEPIDILMSDSSINAVQNKVVKGYVDQKVSDKKTNLSLTISSTTIAIQNDNGDGVTLPPATDILPGLLIGPQKKKIDNSVQREAGKGLSTNDFTNAEKQKIVDLESNKADLNGDANEDFRSKNLIATSSAHLDRLKIIDQEINSFTTDMYINHRDGDNTADRFKSFFIQDGKRNNIAAFIGSTKKSTFYGDIESPKIIKAGASSNDILLGDGSTVKKDSLGKDVVDGLKLSSKNLLKQTDLLAWDSCEKIGFNEYTFEYNKVQAQFPNLDVFPNITYKTDTQYVISFDWKAQIERHDGMIIGLFYTDGTGGYILGNDKTFFQHFEYVTSENKTISRISVTYGSSIGGATTTIKNFSIIEANKSMIVGLADEDMANKNGDSNEDFEAKILTAQYAQLVNLFFQNGNEINTTASAVAINPHNTGGQDETKDFEVYNGKELLIMKNFGSNRETRFYGDIEAPKIIKSGGTPEQVLLADGTTASKDSLSSVDLSVQRNSTEVHVVNNKGNNAIIPSVSSSSAGVMTPQQRLDIISANSHRADVDNPHKINKSKIGLGNVNNTSDTDKPISTAQQNALNGKANLAGSSVQDFKAKRFIKSGGTSSQVLMADGSTVNKDDIGKVPFETTILWDGQPDHGVVQGEFSIPFNKNDYDAIRVYYVESNGVNDAYIYGSQLIDFRFQIGLMVRDLGKLDQGIIYFRSVSYSNDEGEVTVFNARKQMQAWSQASDTSNRNLHCVVQRIVGIKYL